MRPGQTRLFFCTMPRPADHGGKRGAVDDNAGPQLPPDHCGLCGLGVASEEEEFISGEIGGRGRPNLLVPDHGQSNLFMCALTPPSNPCSCRGYYYPHKHIRTSLHTHTHTSMVAGTCSVCSTRKYHVDCVIEWLEIDAKSGPYNVARPKSSR